jgi:predicted component of type VI protein secretion system
LKAFTTLIYLSQVVVVTTVPNSLTQQDIYATVENMETLEPDTIVINVTNLNYGQIAMYV